MIASKHSIYNTKNNSILNYIYFLNLALMEKAWFLAPMKYSLNEKNIMEPKEYTPMLYSPKGKGMVL